MSDKLSEELSGNAPAGPVSWTCARRQLLFGAGIGGVALAAAACSTSTSSGSGGSGSGSGGSGGSGSGGSGGGLVAAAKVPSDSAISVQDSSGRTLLVTGSGGKVTAVDATCTHQGCTVAPAGNQLMCPCHGSTFSLTGQNTGGPAPSPLKNVPVKVVGGEVELA